MPKSKMEDVMEDMLGTKSPDTKKKTDKTIGGGREEESYIRVNFNISKGQRDKLKQYASETAPAHLKISQSQLIRYMIENFDVSGAREDFFKKKY